MQDLKGSTAFVTGAANGIGLGICLALARAGVTVGMADIEAAALDEAVAEIRTIAPNSRGFVLDVSDPAAMHRAAAEAEEAFGELHILVNNAGVSAGSSPVAGVSPATWDWLFGVNVYGALNGIRAFLPRLLRHGQPGHIVNTASIGGLQVNATLRQGSYAATKYAVVAITEALRLDLEDTPIGVSVFCPGLVHTTLDQSARRRPQRFGGPEASPDYKGAQSGISLLPAISAEEAGARVVHGIRENTLFLLTHPETRAWLEERHGRIAEGFASLERFRRDYHGAGGR
ncbi:SDR family NAD(P)-dependent oxidoreductase [Roseomonas sp. BN140053]|uniref:SDR family NAD(P)-dependent oxidoreductase n=1 Tax=Roseomonas sp. BN140053 TaxID=3391898 RepID=UPI0039ED8BFD